MFYIRFNNRQQPRAGARHKRHNSLACTSPVYIGNAERANTPCRDAPREPEPGAQSTARLICHPPSPPPQRSNQKQFNFARAVGPRIVCNVVSVQTHAAISLVILYASHENKSEKKGRTMPLWQTECMLMPMLRLTLLNSSHLPAGRRGTTWSKIIE